jgi:hypothetical protein
MNESNSIGGTLAGGANDGDGVVSAASDWLTNNKTTTQQISLITMFADWSPRSARFKEFPFCGHHGFSAEGAME